MHRSSPPRPTSGAIVAASVSAAVVLSVVMALVLGTHGPRSAPAPYPPSSGARVPVDARVALGAGSPVTVPSSFFGISTEYWTIPVWARQMGLLDRVLAMLSQDGPIRLRIGGDSADRVQWAPRRSCPSGCSS